MPDLLNIVGQDAVLAQLQRAGGGDRRPHAYLFAGPRGVGRRTTAVELARWMLCERPAKQTPTHRPAGLPKSFALRQACGTCPSCTTATAGTNPDLQLVRKELAQYHQDSGIRNRKMMYVQIIAFTFATIAAFWALLLSWPEGPGPIVIITARADPRSIGADCTRRRSPWRIPSAGKNCWTRVWLPTGARRTERRLRFACL